MSIFEKLTDDQLVDGGDERAGREITRRLKDSLVAQMTATNKLTDRIRKLTRILVWLTVALMLLGGVQIVLMAVQCFGARK